MRELKFREWDFGVSGIRDAGWHYWGYINGQWEETIYSQPHKSQGQYVEIKDKSGKEVYEGDLYRQKGCMYPIEVYFDERCAEFKGRVNGETQIDKTYSLMWHNSWKVLGNIYENPELSESK